MVVNCSIFFLRGIVAIFACLLQILSLCCHFGAYSYLPWFVCKWLSIIVFHNFFFLSKIM